MRIAQRLALPAICALAAANFLWQLGSSTYYVDEITSLETALTPLGSLIHAVGRLEVSPPTYFVFLHEWLQRLGSGHAWLHQLAVDHEWVARLPSALCGVLLVAAVYWLCSLVSERRATRLGAAALVALSPFALEYAQLAQPYVFAALAATVAVAAAIRGAEPDARAAARNRWLALSLIASMLAVGLHYTAALVVAPLCLWLALTPVIGKRWRLAYPLVCLATGLALVPLVLRQHQSFPTRVGVSVSGAVDWPSIKRMLEVPFTGRVDALPALGIVLTVATVAAVVLDALRARSGRRSRRLVRPSARTGVLMLAGAVPVCLFLFSVFGGSGFLGHLMLPRYAAAGVPLMIIAIALAIESLPAPAAVALAAGAAVVAIAGLGENHTTSGFYLNARGAVRYLRLHARPSEPILAPDDPLAEIPLMTYGLRAIYTGSEVATAVADAQHGRVWIVAELRVSTSLTASRVLRTDDAALRRFGERALAARVLPGVPSLAIVLVAPLAG